MLSIQNTQCLDLRIERTRCGFSLRFCGETADMSSHGKDAAVRREVWVLIGYNIDIQQFCCVTENKPKINR